MSLMAGEEKRARSDFVGSLRRNATRAEVQELLGKPEDVGRGAKGFEILAYRDNKLQLTFKRGCLFLVAFYFESSGARTQWPRLFPIPAEFSGIITEEELMSWSRARGYSCEKFGSTLRIDDEVSLFVENGMLSSIQILDNELTP